MSRSLLTIKWLALATVVLTVASPAIRAENSTIEKISSLEKRLKPLVASGISVNSYHFAKARAWLLLARDFAAQKDASGIVDEVMGQADSLIDQLEKRTATMSLETLVPSSSMIVRSDLWRRAEEIKADKEFSCAEERVARLEVQLVGAGHAQKVMGWRYARSYLRSAERLVREGGEKLAQCPVLRAKAERAAVPQISSEQPDTPSLSGRNSTEEAGLTPPTSVPILPDRIHFARVSAEVSQESALVLEQVSYVLRAMPKLVIELRGYAIEADTEEENVALSLERAKAVRDYLVETGVGNERMRVNGLGSDNRITALEDGDARSLRVEIGVVAGGSVILEGQDGDLPRRGHSP
jgi:outer membrane protein OmpA-like peptidoglycan-associated protein